MWTLIVVRILPGLLNRSKLYIGMLNGWTELNSYIRITAIKHLNPDSICLGETHLKNDQMINIDNYVPYDH